MTDAITKLVQETMTKYDEYLSEEGVESTNFLIHVLAANIVRLRVENEALRKILSSLSKDKQGLNS